MKKHLILLTILPTLILPSCSSNKFLKRPEDTNLLFWITERVSAEDFKGCGCTYLPGWFGAAEYLDRRYEAIEEEGHSRAPDVHVTYLTSGYPDALDASAITRINITDPTITVYGLTMNSAPDVVESRMKELKFKVNKNGAYYKNNCTFYFSRECISINAPSTNKHHIVY